MFNPLKRVASSVMGGSGDREPKVSKVDESVDHASKSDQLGVNENNQEVKMDDSKPGPSVPPPKEDESKKSESDDDLFGELDSTVNRVILKANELEKNLKYELVDIYCMRIDGRLSVVGGFVLENSEQVKYVWMPASLCKNMTESSVLSLKSKLDAGKKAFAMFYGMKANRYGNDSYDMQWVRKN